MSTNYMLQAVMRNRIGKGASRQLRNNGQIPAVIYGEKQPPLSIAIPYKDIYYKIHMGGFWTSLINIQLDQEEIQVLPKDCQFNPVSDAPLHIDFLRVSAQSMVNVNIPVHFLNEASCPGLKQGGVLNIVRHEIELTAPASFIPEFVEVDLAQCSIGDSIHISAIRLPENVKPVISDRDFTIATIAAPVSLSKEEESGTAG